MYNEEDEYVRGLYVALSILEHSKDKFKASESNDKKVHRKKAYKQLAKDKEHYGKLFRLDKSFCFYAYGDKKDKLLEKLSLEYVPNKIVDKYKVKVIL